MDGRHFLGLTRRALRGRVSDASFLAARELSKLSRTPRSFSAKYMIHVYLHAMYHQFQYIDTNMKYRRIALILICHHMSSYVNNHTRSKYPMDTMEKNMDWIWDQPPPGARRGHQRWRLDAFRPFRPFRHLVAQLKLDCLGVVFFNKNLTNRKHRKHIKA